MAQSNRLRSALWRARHPELARIRSWLANHKLTEKRRQHREEAFLRDLNFGLEHLRIGARRSNRLDLDQERSDE